MTFQRLFPAFPLPHFGHSVPAGLRQWLGYLLDDWRDSRFTNRLSFAELAPDLTEPSASAYKTRDRPEWSELVTNAFTYFTIDVENVRSELNGTTTKYYIGAPSTFTVGTWDVEFMLDALNTTGNHHGLCFMLVDTSNLYAYWVRGDLDYVAMYKNVAGTWTSLLLTAQTRDTSWHVLKVTRDSAGNMEFFYDGVSKGTVVDTDITSSNYVAFLNIEGTDETAHWDDLRVY